MLKSRFTFIYNLIFWYMEGIRRYISGPSFIYVSFIVSEFREFSYQSWVLEFQMFLYQQKVPLQAASGCFFLSNPLKCDQICCKFWQTMQCKVMCQICDSFYSVSNKTSKLGQKADFSAHFQRLFVFTCLRLIIHAPIFSQIKSLMKVHNRGKFHYYSICGCQVTNDQMFS